jgi:hypothetical protein
MPCTDAQTKTSSHVRDHQDNRGRNHDGHALRLLVRRLHVFISADGALTRQFVRFATTD